MVCVGNTKPISTPSGLSEVVTSAATSFRTNVLIVGGAYAGLLAVKSFKTHFKQKSSDPLYASALASKSPKISITLIEPKAGLLNVIGIPKAMVDPEFAKTQFIPMDKLTDLHFDKVVSIDSDVGKDMAAKISPANYDLGIELSYVHGKVSHLDDKSATYSLVGNDEEASILFDYVVMASGRDRTWPTTPDAFTYNSFLQEMQQSHDEYAKSDIVSIIGAGAVGIEIAGDIKHKFPSKTVNLIHPHASFPQEPLSEDFRQLCYDSLKRAGVNIYLNTRIASEQPNGDLITTENITIPSVLNRWCNTHKNNTQILTKNLRDKFVTEKNNIRINEFLQLSDGTTEYANFFVLGDLVDLPIIKSAGWAMYMGRTVANNITSLILDDKLVEPFVDLTTVPKGMVLVAGNGEIVTELNKEVALNHAEYVKEYQDYCVGKVRATMDV